MRRTIYQDAYDDDGNKYRISHVVYWDEETKVGKCVSSVFEPVVVIPGVPKDVIYVDFDPDVKTEESKNNECLACKHKLQHTEQDWEKYHPYRGTGVDNRNSTIKKERE